MTDLLTDTSLVTASEDVVSCPLDGGAALLDLHSRTYFSLNSVGSLVWDLLRSPMSISDIHKVLIARYEVEPDECYSDLALLLRQLADAGLVRIDGADR